MKIPGQIRIGGVEFEVFPEHRLNDGERILAGQIRYMECQIALAAESSHEYKCLSLWHEIMHGILLNIGREDLSNDENFVTVLGNAIYASFEVKEVEK